MFATPHKTWHVKNKRNRYKVSDAMNQFLPHQKKLLKAAAKIYAFDEMEM